MHNPLSVSNSNLESSKNKRKYYEISQTDQILDNSVTE